MANLKPMPGLVLIEPEDRQPRETKSGLLIATPKFEGPPIFGTVIAVADDVTEIAVGDRVWFDEPNPKGFKFEGKGLLPVKAEQVCAIIDKELRREL